MNANEKQSDQRQSKALTFRQKFWLFGVGVPVLLMIVLLALAVFLPKPLNPTERKLLGRWELVDDREFMIGFDRELVHAGRSQSEWEITASFWHVNDDTLTIDSPASAVMPLARLYLVLGWSSHRVIYEIEFLSGDRVQLKNSASGELLQLSRQK